VVEEGEPSPLVHSRDNRVAARLERRVTYSERAEREHAATDSPAPNLGTRGEGWDPWKYDFPRNAR